MKGSLRDTLQPSKPVICLCLSLHARNFTSNSRPLRSNFKLCDHFCEEIGLWGTKSTFCVLACQFVLLWFPKDKSLHSFAVYVPRHKELDLVLNRICYASSLQWQKSFCNSIKAHTSGPSVQRPGYKRRTMTRKLTYVPVPNWPRLTKRHKNSTQKNIYCVLL